MANEEKLRQLIQEIAKKENYENGKIDIKPISSGGANYSSVLYLATVSETMKADLHLFAKVACIGEEMRKGDTNAAQVYITEGIFYDELAPAYEKLYNKYNVAEKDRLVIPKYYGKDLTSGAETMILENLETRGFNSFNRMKPFAWEYASTAVTELAKFHAIGLALREDNQADFEKIVKPFEAGVMNNIEILNFFAMAIQNTCNYLSNEYKTKLEKFCDIQWVGKLLAEIMSKKSMLVHGDFRPSNLMHRRRNGKLEVITLDYQTLTIGNPAVDLIYFMFSGSDEEFRRLHYRRLLDHYFTQLTLRLKQLHVDVEKVYPKETFENDLKEVQIYGLVMCLAGAALLTVDPEEAPEMKDMTSIQVKPNKLALEKINGVIKDFIRWGVL